MAVAVDTKLGPYGITAAIGAGGMGELYRARDTRLDRIVAIKVPPAHLADKPDRRESCEREAKIIESASLNHLHNCMLHAIGRQYGIDYLWSVGMMPRHIVSRSGYGSRPRRSGSMLLALERPEQDMASWMM